MATTIQVSDRTHRILKLLKEQDGRSYDAILQDILRELLDTPQSLAGAYPELKDA